MPANVTHMLIAHKALQTLKAKGVEEFAEFAQMLNDASRDKNYKAYVNLGSLGPDLFYYADIGRSVTDILIDRFMQAKAMTPWSYHLHSHKPNEFPLKLIEIVFSDAIRKKGKIELYDDDIRKLAYIAGHLTHIAADQIIHPVVNSIAGPYYRMGKNRIKHRECEVFQDYFLYEDVYRLEGKSGPKYEFSKQPFHDWIDCVRSAPNIKEQVWYLLRKGLSAKLFLKRDFWSFISHIIGYIRVATFKNTEEWFGYFLQRAFAETYGAFPLEDKIKDSVDYLRLTLWACQRTGPYKIAAKDYEENAQNSAMYQEYIETVDYLKYYEQAVELSAIYLIALYEIYFVLKQGKDFTGQHKKRFGNIVSDADLSCPLKQKIFEKALAALRNEKSMGAAIKTHTPELLRKTKFLTTNRILTTSSDRDIVKA